MLKRLSAIATVRKSALAACFLLAIFGFVRKHRDLDDQDFVQLQVAEARAIADHSMRSSEVAGLQLLDHRKALIEISQQERVLNQQQADDSPTAKLLIEMIKRNVQNLAFGAPTKAQAAETSYVSYENQRSCDIQRALSIDSALLVASLLAFMCGIGLWIVEAKRLLGLSDDKV